MKINQKKGAQLFLLFSTLVFCIFAGQLTIGLVNGSLSPAVLLFRIMIILIVAGLVAFLWWLNKEADY